MPTSAEARRRATIGILCLALWSRPAAAASAIAYLSHPDEGTVSVLDTAAAVDVATVAVGAVPMAVAVSHDGAHVYVANAGSDTVTVMDARMRTVTATVPVGTSPQAVAAAPDGTHVYVANAGDGTVSVIDATSNVVTATVPVASEPVSVAFDPAGTRAYVTGFDTITVLDVGTGTVVTSVPVTMDLSGGVVTPDGQLLVVAEHGAGAVAVLDTATNTVTRTVAVGSSPVAVAIGTASSGDTRLYVANAGDATVSVLDGGAQTVVDTLSVGAGPIGLAATPEATRLYVVNAGDPSITIVDIAGHIDIPTTTRPAASSVHGIAITPAPPDPSPAHWSLVQSYVDPMPTDFEELGSATTITASTVNVGAPGDDTHGEFGGAVQRFDAVSGALLGTIADPGNGAHDRFGLSLAAVPRGDGGADLLVGAPGTAGGGAAYLFDGSNAALLQTITNPGQGGGDGFGFAVTAVDDGTGGSNLVIGAPFDSSTAQHGGAVYLFARDETVPLATLRNDASPPEAFFGAAVVGAGTRLVVGAPFESTDAMNGGAAFVFDHPEATPEPTLTLRKTAPASGDLLGAAVATAPGAGGAVDILVGAPGDGGIGAVYRFDGASGTPGRIFHDPPASSGDAFGASIATAGSQLVVGAPGNSMQGTNAGAAFAMDLATGDVTGTFLDPLRGEGDRFGFSVAAPAGSPDLFVGAPRRRGLSPPMGSPLRPHPVLDAGVLYRFSFCGDACPVNGCGNGIVTAGEECDDGCLAGVAGTCEAVDDGDGCDADCTTTTCGNGVVGGFAADRPEVCDDGALNGTPGDRCTAACQLTCTLNSECPHAPDLMSGTLCNGICDFECSVMSLCAGCTVDDCSSIAAPPPQCDGCCAVACPEAGCLSDAGCDDGIACTVDTCDLASQACVHVPDDSRCDDGARCTADICDPATGCSNPPLPGCCATDGDCRNDNSCDGEEGCRVCEGCFLHAWPCCAPGTGGGSECVAGKPPPEGTSCSTGNPCTLDSCVAQSCVTGPPRDCDDGNPCTTDSCDEVTGCVHPYVPGCQTCQDATECNDQNPCTTDVCDGTCANRPRTDGASCDDGDVCNGAETCRGGLCQAGTPLDCDDGDPCTRDTCDPIGGCMHGLPDRFASLECALGQLGTGAACAADRIPSAILGRLTRAKHSIESAATTSKARRKRLLTMAVAELRGAGRAIAHAAHKHRLSEPCGATLMAAVHDDAARAAELKSAP
ncbi:MAG TPA: beta-propeller fold lactonase family protein [Candidatus Binatia bacterium]|nr:beta-propeller fold lactonase family protein [Candidatus Binatia bacterium]